MSTATLTERDRVADDLASLGFRALSSAVRIGTYSQQAGLRVVTSKLKRNETYGWNPEWCERAKAVLSTYGVGV